MIAAGVCSAATGVSAAGVLCPSNSAGSSVGYVWVMNERSRIGKLQATRSTRTRINRAGICCRFFPDKADLNDVILCCKL